MLVVEDSRLPFGECMTHAPWLLPSKVPSQDDHRAPMGRLEFIRNARHLAKDKAYQLGWII